MMLLFQIPTYCPASEIGTRRSPIPDLISICLFAGSLLPSFFHGSRGGICAIEFAVQGWPAASSRVISSFDWG